MDEPEREPTKADLEDPVSIPATFYEVIDSMFDRKPPRPDEEP